MRALRFLGDKKITIDIEPDPVPGPGEVVIKTAASVICGSEMGCYRGSDGMNPGNPGHEAAGIVVKCGPGVTAPMVGQRVGVSAVGGCGDPKCAVCRAGKYTWCTRFSFHSGMHAEQFIAAADACHVLPDDVDWATGVLITGDGFGVPYHTSKKFIDKNAENVAIFGAGPIGLGSVIMQSSLGRRVFVVDISPERLDYAMKLGAAAVFNPKDTDAVAGIRELTGGLGADVCIEAAGRPETAKNCFAAVRTGGQVIFDGEQGEVPLNISEDFIRRDITATGSWFYHFCEYDDMLEKVREGFPIRKLITHEFPFTSAQEAYDLFAAGKTGKVLLTYD